MYILVLTLAVQCYMPFVWKLSAIRKYDTRVILLLNYVVTVAISTVLAIKNDLFSVLSYLPKSDITALMKEKSLENTALILIIVGVLAGVAYYLSLYFSQRNIAVNGMGISSFFTQTGLVGSLLTAFFFFDEQITGIQWLAIVGILFSIMLFTCGNSKITIKSPWLLIAVFVFNLAVGTSNKFYARYALESYKTAFLAIAFFIAFVSAAIKIYYDYDKSGNRFIIDKGEILFGLTLGAANLGYSYLNLKCLESLPAAIVVPTLSAGGLVVSTLLAVFLFRERSNYRHALAILLSCVFIYLLNI